MPAKTKKVCSDVQPIPLNPVPESFLGAIHQGDCIERMQALPDGCVQLVFADPPFNIGYDYDVYDDSLEYDQYLEWTKRWIQEVHRILAPTGTFWLAIGDEYAAELKVISQQLGFHCRSWVVWYYTFGVHCRAKFTRSHAHLFHFVKDSQRFLFNADQIAVPSARQLVYADARANPKGRTPDDTWILRPQDCIESFTPNEDTWYIPRVNGTFKERAGFHGCQMPEQLLGRILRACSSLNDVILDPFSGSATTVAVAKKLGRQFIGFDLSTEYVSLGTDRLNRIAVGQALDGSSEPKVSAPSTDQGKRRDNVTGRRSRTASKTIDMPLFDRLLKVDEQETEGFDDEERLLDAYEATFDGASPDRVIIDPILNQDFQLACDARKIRGIPRDRNRTLLRLRKIGKLQSFTLTEEQIVAPKWSEVDRFAHASEIAWRRVSDLYRVDLEELFCDPRLAEAFDRIASDHAPGRSPLEYRWVALALRQRIRSAQSMPDQSIPEPTLASLDEEWRNAPWRKWIDLDLESLPTTNTLYAIAENEDTTIDEPPQFVGVTTNLRHRLASHGLKERWEALTGTASEHWSVQWIALPADASFLWFHRRRALQSSPPWNVLDDTVAPSSLAR